MPISMYQACVPTFIQLLGALSGQLDKASAYCAARRIDPAALLAARLYPDMYPFTRQVQTAADFAKSTVARLAGVDAPRFEDTETSFDELKARAGRTIEYVTSFKPEQIDGSEERDITLSLGERRVTFRGERYLIHFALPNFYFHLTAAYAILRHNGVDVGKRDFLGPVPGE